MFLDVVEHPLPVVDRLDLNDSVVVDSRHTVSNDAVARGHVG